MTPEALARLLAGTLRELARVLVRQAVKEELARARKKKPKRRR